MLAQPHEPTALEEPDWRAMDLQELDRAFNNMASVPDSEAITANWVARSERLRHAYPAQLDLPYGPGRANRLDFLKAAEGAPVLVFLHGGYWHTRSKEDFTFCAEGPLKRGINVALVGYTLAPAITLDGIANEVRSALDFLAVQLPTLGGDPARLVIGGWSAGGQLATLMLDHPYVKAVLAVSGIFDLEPLRYSSMNKTLRLTAQQAQQNSPICKLAGTNKPISVTVGAQELPMLRSQAAAYAQHRINNRLAVAYEEIPLNNHFTILDELASADGRLTQLVRQMLL